MAGIVPGIVVLALGAGALGGPDALRLLLALAGRHPLVDICICLFAFSVVTAQLLGAVLLARFVREAPPASGDGGAGAGRRRAPATDLFARIALLLSVAAVSLVLVAAGTGLGSVRPLVYLAAKYCYHPIAIAAAAGAALLYATPLRRLFREPRNARGRTAAATRFIGLRPLVAVAAAVFALVAAIPFGGRGGFDALSRSPGFSSMLLVAVSATMLAVAFYRRTRSNAVAVGGGDAALQHADVHGRPRLHSRRHPRRPSGFPASA